MLHQRFGSTTRTTRRGTALAAGLLAATTVLAGCGVVSISDPRSSAAEPAASSPVEPAPVAPETGSTQEPSPEVPLPSVTTSVPSTAGPTTPAPSTTTPSPTSTSTAPKPAPKPTTSAPATPKPKPVPTEGDTLHVGDSGPYVRSVQQRLTSLGYWNGSADGQFGMLTAQAVMALQKAAGLGRDGVYGPSTRAALKNGVRPQSRLGGTGIEIDKARQLLLVVRGGRVTTILNTSTGSGERYTSNGVEHVATTPAGTFSTFRSVDRLDKGPLGDLWRPRYFNGGIAVHGAGSIPGYPASHGCARVSNPAMDMIWANGLMPIGSRVTVY
ncbi:hypothetical protein GCM10009867_12450 [Pedococcus aerophilus]|uniref:L,D-TPase catalytic domain-containing protein n=1 Tax=Pedococcus aerophilus TaxID=436356 RepID=A0ABP6H1C5_9MICO